MALRAATALATAGLLPALPGRLLPRVSVQQFRFVGLQMGWTGGYAGSMLRIGIVGSGIAGMSCAYLLQPHAEITVFEKDDWVGGHANTVAVKYQGEEAEFDSGFMVYNEVTYPRLTALFEALQVPVMDTDMSFGVHHVPDRLEYCGSNLNTLFAQRSNFFRAGFWKMLLDVHRFNRDAHQYLESGAAPEALHDFILKRGYGERFVENYLLPMTSAIWSTPPDEMLRFPAQALLNFMRNHGLLGVSTHHQWKTVRGGSAHYRDRLIASFRDRIRTATPVLAVNPHEHGVAVRDSSGRDHQFDKVVIAAHADEALAILGHPTPLQTELLGAFQYARNLVVVHTDRSVMPRSRRAWASWNYRMDRGSHGSILSSTHYWMNNLQSLSKRHDYFVSVNAGGLVDPALILRRFNYAHPTFDGAAIAAQARLPELNSGKEPIYFCGSYFRYGFHEDALMAGMQAADAVLQQPVSHAILSV